MTLKRNELSVEKALVQEVDILLITFANLVAKVLANLVLDVNVFFARSNGRRLKVDSRRWLTQKM